MKYCLLNKLQGSQKRRGSRVPDDDDDESEYFRVKPENKVVMLGQYFLSSCTVN